MSGDLVETACLSLALGNVVFAFFVKGEQRTHHLLFAILGVVAVLVP